MIKRTTLVSFVFIFAMFGGIGNVHAAEVPTLALYPTTGSSVVQTTIINADPNVSVILHYPNGGSVLSANIGTSNSIGYLNTTVDSSTFGIAAGSQVYVSANGAASPSVVWPTYTSSGSLSLSQGSLTLGVGNNAVVNALTSASVSVSSNSSPSVASASVSGNQVNIFGLASGVTNISVCAVNIGCSTIAVTVSSTGTSQPSSLYIAQNNIGVVSGQTQAVSISGSGNYYISANSNPGVASANVSGATLNISGLAQGTTNINLCSTGSDGSSTCVPVTVSVTAGTVATNPAQAVPTFGQTQVNLSVGQNQTVAIYGSAPFTLGSNSDATVVTPSINGNSVTLYGLAAGGANISICQFSSGGCANLYAYVAPVGTTQAQTPTSTGAPALSSISLTSTNSSNSITSAGNMLNVTFNLNQTVSTPTVTIAGAQETVTGTGSGPYTASYTMTGNETQPVNVALSFISTAGLGGQATFTLAAPVGAASTVNTSGTGNFSFTNYLSPGSSGTEVTALQTILGRLGFLNTAATGTYGPQTTAAVEAFQSAHKLDALGVVGPATRAALNTILTTGAAATVSSNGFVFNNQLSVGSKGTDVTELQNRLKALGIYSGPVTGDFEALTKQAVQAYQKLHGLEQLGSVGPGTRAALNAGN